MPTKQRPKSRPAAPRTRGRSPDWPALAPFLGVVALGLVLLPGFREHLTSDGVSYLSIAEHYAEGRFGDAVNGYWSPLLSWLLAPLVGVGIPGPLAFKLLSLAIAVGVLAAVRRVARGFQVGRSTLTMTSWALVVPLVAAAYSVISPDLLVVIPVLLYLDALVRAGQAPWWRTGLLAGGWAGLGYLTKLFVLPFVGVHLLVAIPLLAWRHSWATALKVAAVAAVVAGVMIGGWTAALTAKYDTVTPGTAAAVNLGYLQDGSRGAEPLWAGLLPPPHEHAVSSWEDIVVSTELAENLPETAGGSGAGETGGVGGLVRTAFGQLDEFIGALVGWLPVLLLAALLPWVVRADRARRRRRHPGLAQPAPLLLVGLAALVWAGGVLLTHVEARYLWAALLAATILAALVLDAWRTARPRGGLHELAALLLIVGLLPWAGMELNREWRATDGLAAVAHQAAETDLAGARVASLSQWVRSVGFCYYAECTYYGVPRTPATPEEFREEVERYQVEYLLAYRDPPVELGLGEPALVVNSLQIFDLR